MSDWRPAETPDRDLTIDELHATVEWLGNKPWHDLCLDVDASRAYQELFRGERLSTWLIRWGQEADTGFPARTTTSPWARCT